MPTPAPRRPGYTLIEMLVASVSAGVLMVGMASTLMIASQSLELNSGGVTREADLHRALDRLTGDVRHAKGFTERTATAMTFTVPDRTGDGEDDTLRYAWSGVAGDPLTLEFNGATPIVVAGNVTGLNFDFLERQLLADPLITSRGVIYEGFTHNSRDTNQTSTDVATPAGASEDELLIAVLALDGAHMAGLSTPPGWVEVVRDENGSSGATIGVWRRTVDANEPATHTFTWSSGAQSFAWMMRFSGQDLAEPIADFANQEGKDDAPPAPSVEPGVEDALVLRVGAFDKDEITHDDPGVTGHTPILMDGNNHVTGGAAYTIHPADTTVPGASFSLTKSEDYLTVTIAIKPDR